ncbi:MAG: hypothetical protein JSS83_14155 [Cyanobacteria bacterium SZAS LIN-3]|nr:hypothetical protein [Cyanobacteria bacterium SZAS LIN-3]
MAIAALVLGFCALAPAVAAGNQSLESVYKEPLLLPPASCRPAAAVRGVLFGKPFVADEAYINSCTLILKQKHKIYNRLVLNFLALGTPLPGQEFFSRGKVQPGVEVFQRLKNGEKMNGRIFEGGVKPSAYALHVRFGGRAKCPGRDTVPGSIALRFAGGDYVVGTFVARQSSRIIWDDETVVP